MAEAEITFVYGRAISDFNKRIKKLETLENKKYLPDILNYKEEKSRIVTRQELNRLINSLKQFQREGSDKLITLKSGEKITKWEKQNLDKLKNIAIKQLNKEIANFDKPNIQGITKRQMGSNALRGLEKKIENLNSLENKTGYELKKLKQRLNIVGKTDFRLRKASVFRENLLESLKEQAKTNSEFYKVINRLNRIKNPDKFYEYVRNSEQLLDFWVWYKSNPLEYGNFNDVEDFVDNILNDLGED